MPDRNWEPKPRTEIPIPMHSETLRSREVICDIHSSYEFSCVRSNGTLRKEQPLSQEGALLFFRLSKSPSAKIGHSGSAFDLTQKKTQAHYMYSAFPSIERGVGIGPHGPTSSARCVSRQPNCSFPSPTRIIMVLDGDLLATALGFWSGRVLATGLRFRSPPEDI